MEALDINSVINTLIAGGAIYAGIRIEIKYLWRDVDDLKKRVNKVEEK